MSTFQFEMSLEPTFDENNNKIVQILGKCK